MKQITFAVPCYNSESYMERCIDSLLAGGQDVEIIIVNDGSKDATAAIAEDYQSKYPGIIRAIHQVNAGHGGAVNTGLRHARGKYFKVVDSDDWLDTSAVKKLCAQLRDWEKGDSSVDLLVCNYIYDHLHENEQRQVQYRNVFQPGRICGWEDIGRFTASQYLIMHALIFNTATLRKSGVELPQHTFYVDNIFAYQPLPYAKKLCYLDLDLYHYFLGRDDQSVNESVLCSRIDQQIAVTKIITRCADLETILQPKLCDYMLRNISIMMAISSIHLLLIGTEEALNKRRALWEYVKQNNPRIYWKLRYQSLSGLTYLPGKIGGMATVTGYRAAKKFYKFQ